MQTVGAAGHLQSAPPGVPRQDVPLGQVSVSVISRQPAVLRAQVTAWDGLRQTPPVTPLQSSGSSQEQDALG
jgi:hypothetical protein